MPSAEGHTPGVVNAEDLSVVTERLGWPPRKKLWRRVLLWEAQERLVYDDQSEVPTATCHLQRQAGEDALCGHPWQLLIGVPDEPAWTDLHPDLRCIDCSEEAGLVDEDPTGRQYRHRWDYGRGSAPQQG